MSEIIINGIDVSECRYLNKVVNEELYCNIDEEHLYTCSSDENCYFKQLKGLQEENKELKKQLEFSRTHKAVLDAERIKYKQALEEIKNIAELDVCYNAKLDKYTFNTYAQRILDTINEVLNDRN